MSKLRSHIALLLLTCFMRVLVPEAWILALHSHQHTEHEVAREQPDAKAQLSEKHQHCPVDHLFDVPFQPTAELTVPHPFYSYARPEATPQESVWDNTTPAAAWLRGPPAQA
ncbi:hypothetical protein [Hymenobacter sp. B81]|uniref:hypothetical protein n=1 Tax=Hymenobacter sp. B81 TaxID=3344878 RepID=UPI0037DD0B04